MKIRISYFYQIRFFPRHFIPMSTCISDPDWFHDWQGSDYIYQDKRGILNGLRLKPIIVQGNHGECGCPCEKRDPAQCDFLKQYQANLEQIDFNKMLKGIETFCNDYCKKENIQEEPVAVLIVYEAPNNPCSERQALIDYFNSHGIDCKELDYPINNIQTKQKDFIF